MRIALPVLLALGLGFQAASPLSSPAYAQISAMQTVSYGADEL